MYYLRILLTIINLGLFGVGSFLSHDTIKTEIKKSKIL